jgi:hypothetical protein
MEHSSAFAGAVLEPLSKRERSCLTVSRADAPLLRHLSFQWLLHDDFRDITRTELDGLIFGLGARRSAQGRRLAEGIDNSSFVEPQISLSYEYVPRSTHFTNILSDWSPHRSMLSGVCEMDTDDFSLIGSLVPNTKANGTLAGYTILVPGVSEQRAYSSGALRRRTMDLNEQLTHTSTTVPRRVLEDMVQVSGEEKVAYAGYHPLSIALLYDGAKSHAERWVFALRRKSTCCVGCSGWHFERLDANVWRSKRLSPFERNKALRHEVVATKNQRTLFLDVPISLPHDESVVGVRMWFLGIPYVPFDYYSTLCSTN